MLCQTLFIYIYRLARVKLTETNFKTIHPVSRLDWDLIVSTYWTERMIVYMPFNDSRENIKEQGKFIPKDNSGKILNIIRI